MFIRKKQNKSGTISVQVIDKRNGYKVVKTIGSSRDVDAIERYVQQAHQFIHQDVAGQGWLFSGQSKDEVIVESFVEQLSNAQIRTVGPELIFGTLFDRIGFSAIPDEMFRHLVIARLAFPLSKLKTVDYLRRYLGIDKSVDAVYRFLDKLKSQHKEQVCAIAYKHTLKRLDTVACVFYDMTTLYFEAEEEDDLRRIGFSKDGKFQCPQILLGLLVGKDGLPIGYDIFEGNRFEGHTLLPVLRRIQSAYGFEKPIVIADAGLLSNANIQQLKQDGYRFIIGGRIKNEGVCEQRDILKRAVGMRDGDGFVITKSDGTRLVVTYSQCRAKKDAANRERGLERLRAQIRGGRLTKQSINNRGYNRFLRIMGSATVNIDEEKVVTDKKWDGLKGYVSNTDLSAQAVAENYKHLWHIEKAFRISKSDLKVRPVYHYLRHRIEAHICIAFVAYAIYKELEYQLHRCGITMTSKRAAELTQNMYELEYILSSGQIKRKILKMDTDQEQLYRVIAQS